MAINSVRLKREVLEKVAAGMERGVTSGEVTSRQTPGHS